MALGVDDMVGRYRLVQRLGAGAMGVVWSAQDPQLDRRVAIKLVHPNLARSSDASGRLLREARAMAKLSSRAVVTVHDAGEVDGRLFLAMELVEGTTLGAMLRGRDAAALADWPRWLDMMIEAGGGLVAAHQAGVLHRDFKPDNVLVDTSGRVCVGDFGVASLGDKAYAAAATLRWEADAPPDLTTTGALLGTPVYMSPQQLRGEVIDARADQFAFCVATFEALYGVRPFQVSQNGMDVLPALCEAIEHQRIAEPPAGSIVFDEVRAVLVRGLAADPEARWPDIETLLGELERAASAGRRRLASVVELPAASRSRGRLYVGIGLAVVVAITMVKLASTSRTSEPPAPAVAPGQLVAKKLFQISSRGRMALSPDGTRVALGSDRLEVRSLDSDQRWVLPIGADEITHIELDADSVRFATASKLGVSRWNYVTNAPIEQVDYGRGLRWFGTSALGEVMQQNLALFVIADGGREVRSWPTGNLVELVAISPDKHRIAYLDADRFAGQIVIRDLATDRVVTSERLVAATALEWSDNSTLVYALGTSEHPTIHRRPITATGFGAATEIYSTSQGWFGQIAIRGARMLVSDLHPSTRAKMIDLSKVAPEVVDYDRTTVGITLGWTRANELVSWSGDRGLVELRTGDRVTVTRAKLPGEPANTTFADDVLIAAIRRPDGREAVAVSLATGELLWKHSDKRTFAVRCANDLHPPCYAIRADADGDRVFEIDPRTGILEGAELYRGRVEDIAVRDDGERWLIATRSPDVTERDRRGKQVASYRTPLVSTRSVAYDPRGGIIVAGTMIRNKYAVGRIAAPGAELVVLASSFDDILTLVRPAHDGSRVQLLARVFVPDVWQLDAR